MSAERGTYIGMFERGKCIGIFERAKCIGIFKRGKRTHTHIQKKKKSIENDLKSLFFFLQSNQSQDNGKCVKNRHIIDKTYKMENALKTGT